MKAKKIGAFLLSAAMVVTLTACGGSEETSAPAETPAVEEQAEEPAAEEPAEEPEAEEPVAEEAAPVDASIDFEDGLYGFAGLDTVVNPAGDASTFEVADVNGSKALVITRSSDKSAFIALQADALLGDNISNLASVDMTIGLNASTFAAASGSIYYIIGGEAFNGADWSVYLESSNPKTYTADAPSALAEGDYIVVSLESDTSGAQQGFYIDDIVFKDASGNKLDADTSAEFVAADTGVDRSNLFGISGEIVVEGLAGAGDAWSQIGYQELTDEEFEALKTPGSVVEISYSSNSGNMWMGLSGNQWLRIGVGDADGSGQGYSYYNSSRSIAQITYETIVSVCGEDTDAWDKAIFLESDDAFEVYSVKIGQQAPSYTITGAIDTGITGASDGWGQIGYQELTEEQLAVLKTPGSIVQVEYSSESGDMWIGLSGNNWLRVGVGNADGSGTVDAITDGSKCYVTYDMIAEVCGEDTDAWDVSIFAESDTAFEVYSIKIGMAAELVPNNKQIDLELSGAGDGWGQIGYQELTEDQLAALKTPGSVVVCNYTSESGDLWIGLSGNNWMRVGVGNADGSGTVDAATDGSFCYVTYDMIAEVCGEDTDAWDVSIFVESDTAFEVYSVKIGQTE